MRPCGSGTLRSASSIAMSAACGEYRNAFVAVPFSLAAVGCRRGPNNREFEYDIKTSHQCTPSGAAAGHAASSLPPKHDALAPWRRDVHIDESVSKFQPLWAYGVLGTAYEVLHNQYSLLRSRSAIRITYCKHRLTHPHKAPAELYSWRQPPLFQLWLKASRFFLRRWRARLTRDSTVPSGTPRVLAVS